MLYKYIIPWYVNKSLLDTTNFLPYRHTYTIIINTKSENNYFILKYLKTYFDI